MVWMEKPSPSSSSKAFLKYMSSMLLMSTWSSPVRISAGGSSSPSLTATMVFAITAIGTGDGSAAETVSTAANRPSMVKISTAASPYRIKCFIKAVFLPLFWFHQHSDTVLCYHNRRENSMERM